MGVLRAGDATKIRIIVIIRTGMTYPNPISGMKANIVGNILNRGMICLNTPVFDDQESFTEALPVFS